MAVTKQTAIIEWKSETKEVTKDIQGVNKELKKTSDNTDMLIGQFDKMTGGAASAFQNAAKGTKSFITGLKATRAAVIATGIGALVVGVVALVSAFTKTNKGAKQLQRVMAGLGAVLDNLRQRFAAIGGAIVGLFSGGPAQATKNYNELLEGLENNLGKVFDKAVELERAQQRLRETQRDLNKQFAEGRAQIKEYNLIAEDTTKDINTRIEAAEKAIAIELDLQKQREEQAREALRIAKEKAAQADSDEDTLDEINALEVELINIRTESAELQTTLNNKLNILNQERKRNAEAAAEAEKKAEEEKAAAAKKAAEEEEKRAQEELKARQELEDELYALTLSAQEREELALLQQYDERIRIAGDDEGLIKAATEQFLTEQAALEQRYRDESDAAQEEQKQKELDRVAELAQKREELLFASLNALADLNAAFGGESIERAEEIAEIEARIAEETDAREKYRLEKQAYDLAVMQDREGKKTFERNKAINIAAALVQTYLSANKAYTSQIIPGDPTSPFRAALAAGAAVASGLANVNQIRKTKYQSTAVAPTPPPPPSTSGGGGTGSPDTSAGTSLGAPQLDLSFLGEGAGQAGPVQAYVISQEVTTAQQANQLIEEQASL
jgi:chemotaxis protein histidine kinase CheA